jgi:hypothetical protein
MTQPDPQTNDEALLAKLADAIGCEWNSDEDGFEGYDIFYQEPETGALHATGIGVEQLAKLLPIVEAAIKATLDRIADSVKQHTVPEGKDLVTRSYVLNTIEFERGRASLQTGGKS